MSASIKPFPSPLRRRFKEAEAGMAALEDMGHVVAGMSLTTNGAIILLRDHPANDRLMGEVRRVYRDSEGIWIEMEKRVDQVRVRWIRPWSRYIHAPRRVH